MPDQKRILNRLLQILNRFSQDLIGLVLICFSIISFLSLVGLTEGAIPRTLSIWLAKGFGWGSYLFAVFIGYLGIQILLRRFERFPKINLKKVIYLELAIFTFMSLLNLLQGLSIDRANQGYDGGIIGWGMSYLLVNAIGFPLTSILLSVLTMYFCLAGSGLLEPVGNRLDTFFSKTLSRSFSGSDHRQQKTIRHDTKDEILKSSAQQSKGKKPAKDTVNFDRPDLDLLVEAQQSISDESFIHAKAVQIEKSLAEFGVPARVAGYRVGPTIVQYAVEPGYIERVNNEGNVVRKKVRVAQIANLRKDLALALSVERLRIEAPIPGHSFVGIEIPNVNSTLVRLKTIIKSDEFQQGLSSLNLALGLDVSGNPVLADLGRMPHLLIAGTTGSGKSVCITSLITCLIFNNSPADLKIAILDPKMVELVRFNGLPHLMGKVETELDRMLGVLAWLVKEMEDRYRMLESVHARDLDDYNEKMFRRGKVKLPKIVVFIDELADLMLTAPDQTESYLVRLAQMARATGIHLVVATQRPSTDIITGLIKANFPARISFLMASSVDSRVILDENGAETLMGSGDMLFLNPEISGLMRAQSVIVDDREIDRIISFWQNQSDESQAEEEKSPWEELVPDLEDDSDELLQKAARLIRKEGRASTSWLQRKMHIGFPRAARLMDELEEIGVVGPLYPGAREREIIPEHHSEDAVDALE